MDNPYNDRDILKALWNEAKLNVVLHCDAPTDYPKMPSMLMDTHPDIFLRTYVGDEQPILPPAAKNIHSLNILKSTTGCRNSKGNGFTDPCNMILPRYHLALETMLVFGKLRPQRLRGQLY